jgi:hypothetical protein
VAKKTSVATPTEHRTWAFPFAASRETHRLHSYPNADTQQHRSQAAKPKLLRFVNIRVHSWFKHHSPAIIRENPCPSVAKEGPFFRDLCREIEAQHQFELQNRERSLRSR